MKNMLRSQYHKAEPPTKAQTAAIVARGAMVDSSQWEYAKVRVFVPGKAVRT